MSSSRSAPYRSACPPIVHDRIMEAQTARMFLLQEPGPTSFVLREQAGDGEEGPAPRSSPKFRVYIGDRQRCSCGDTELCVHVLFVMLKVLKVPVSSPLLWQWSLTDAEINKILADREAAAARQRSQAMEARFKRAHAARVSSADALAAPSVTRKPLVAGETCPICMEDMTVDEVLTWCQQSCGNSVHNRCMRVWAEHKQASSLPVTCPLCREPWGDGQTVAKSLREDAVSSRRPTRRTQSTASSRATSSSRGVSVHPLVACSLCGTTPVYGNLYRCVVCADHVELCARCFHRQRHVEHPFVFRERPRMAWKPAVRQGEAEGTPAELLALQDRELTTDDYHLLLSLDQGGNKPLPEYLAGLLSTVEGADGTCEDCGTMLSVGQAVQAPCGHVLHLSCVIGLMSQRHNKCPHDHGAGGQPLFPGLVPKRRVRRVVDTAAEAPDDTDAFSGMVGRGLPTPSPLAASSSTASAIVQGRLARSRRSTPGSRPHGGGGAMLPVTGTGLSVGTGHVSTPSLPPLSASSRRRPPRRASSARQHRHEALPSTPPLALVVGAGAGLRSEAHPPRGASAPSMSSTQSTSARGQRRRPMARVQVSPIHGRPGDEPAHPVELGVGEGEAAPVPVVRRRVPPQRRRSKATPAADASPPQLGVGATRAAAPGAPKPARPPRARARAGLGGSSPTHVADVDGALFGGTATFGESAGSVRGSPQAARPKPAAAPLGASPPGDLGVFDVAGGTATFGGLAGMRGTGSGDALRRGKPPPVVAFGRRAGRSKPSKP